MKNWFSTESIGFVYMPLFVSGRYQSAFRQRVGGSKHIGAVERARTRSVTNFTACNNNNKTPRKKKHED